MVVSGESEHLVNGEGGATRRVPPGPRGVPGLGVIPQLARDPYGSLQRIAHEYGDVATVPIPGMRMVLISHPDYVKHITNTNHAMYPKPELFRDILFREPPRFHGMANGEEWRRVRRMLNPKFTARGLAPIEELIVDAIEDGVESWDRFATSGTRVDIQEQLSLVTMSVLLRSMFTLPAPPAEVERLASHYAQLMNGMAITMLCTPLPQSLPRPFARRYEAAKAAIGSYIDAMVAERRRNPIPDGDLLSMILSAEFEDGTAMTDEHIRRELMGLIFGGYETTAAVMSWVLARLPFSPHAQERAYEEVDALGSRRLGHDDLDRLPWLRACFDEAQRLQGFVINAREASIDDEIGGYVIPAGTTVAFSGQTLHRDPRWWRDPDRFDPSRFVEGEINQYAFLPFGIGPRRCLGYRMAYMVGLWTLAAAFQRYRLELPPGWRPKPRFVFSTTVKGGVPVQIHRRRGI